MTTPIEANKDVVLQFFQDALNERNLDEVANAVNKLVDPDHVFRTPDPSEEKRGRDMLASIVILLRTISPDLRVRVDEDEIVASGDIILSRWSAKGTVSARLKKVLATNHDANGVAATDDKLQLSAISVFRVSGGKIKETWQSLEALRDQTPLQVLVEVLAQDPRIGALGSLEWCCKFWPRCCGK